MANITNLNTYLQDAQNRGLTHDEIVNDLRIWVHDGEDLENNPELYMLLIEKIRNGRRTANALSETKKAAKAKTSVKTSRRLTTEERDKLLNEELF